MTGPVSLSCKIHTLQVHAHLTDMRTFYKLLAPYIFILILRVKFWNDYSLIDIFDLTIIEKISPNYNERSEKIAKNMKFLSSH